jgi:hypothetical protein
MWSTTPTFEPLYENDFDVLFFLFQTKLIGNILLILILFFDNWKKQTNKDIQDKENQDFYTISIELRSDEKQKENHYSTRMCDKN